MLRVHERQGPTCHHGHGESCCLRWLLLYFLVVGNLHARKREFTLNRMTYKPFASYFRDAIVIKLSYHGGHYYNFGIKKMNSRVFPGREISKSRSKFFDLEVAVPSASPVRPLKLSN